MSDELNEYLRKVDAMFDTAEHQLVNICLVFVQRMAWPLIDNTPGPNLQYPEDTEYIATGRLRAGWKVSLRALGNVDQWDGGPYTEHGDDTLAAIEGQLAEYRGAKLSGLPKVLFLVNGVAYGYIVHWGLGRHTIARPWVDNVATDAQADAAKGAIAQVMRG